jgi:hypothetical protein
MISSHKRTRGVLGEQGTDIVPALREMLIQDPRIGRVETRPQGSGSLGSRDESARKEFHAAPSIAPAESSLDPKPQQANLQTDRISGDRPSVGWRVFQTVARGVIVISMVGAAFALLSNGDDRQRDLVNARDSSLRWLSSVLRSDSDQSPDGVGERVFKPLDQTQLQNTTPLPDAPAIQSSQPSVPTGLSPGPQHQLEAMASDLADVRRLVEQLAAKEDQMERNIATLQTTVQNVSQKLSSLPESLTTLIPHKKIVRASHR